MISETTIIVAASDQVSRDLDGEAAILNLDSGIYYGLNSSGARIWSLLSRPTTASTILDVLLSEYEVEVKVCRDDLFKLLNQLAEAGLIEVRDEGNP